MVQFYLKLKSKPAFLGLLIACLILFWLSYHAPLIQSAEWKLQDFFIKHRADQRKASDHIVVLDIDDTSLIALGEILGKWPWPRSVHAEILEYLQTHEPKAIIFDILFSEPDLYRPDSDAYFYETLKATPNVFLATSNQPTLGSLSAPLMANNEQSLGLIKTPKAKPDARALFLLPQFSGGSVIEDSEDNNESAFYVGSIDLLPDHDGITRRYYVHQDFDGWLLPSLPARVSQALNARMPDQNAILLDWFSGETTPHQRFSYAEVLAQARAEGQFIPDKFFKDKIVVIGTSALGLHDLRATPINDFYPGVFILSTALDNMMNGEKLIQQFQYVAPIATLILLITMLYLFCTQTFLIAILLGIFGSLSTVLLSGTAALSGTIILILPSIIALLFFTAGGFVIIYQQHRAKLQKTIQLFSRFMDPAIVSKLLEQQTPEELLSTKHVEVTMLFSDIRNFTTISEQRTAGEMVNLLNTYFDRQVQTLFKHKATLDKFIGDAVMAFWGAPLEHEEHPIYAINAALDMIDNLNDFVQEYGYQDFDIGIGIHTGHAVVGLIGSHERYDYTAIGDTVNLASRIEGLTKGRSRILVSETTKEIAEAHFSFIPQGEFQVKGRTKPVKVFEPRRKTPESKQDKLNPQPNVEGKNDE